MVPSARPCTPPGTLVDTRTYSSPDFTKSVAVPPASALTLSTIVKSLFTLVEPKYNPGGRLVGCLIGSLDLGRAQFRRLGLQYLHGLRDFWVRLRVPRTRHERGRCDEASSGQETNKKALAIHASRLLYERRSWNEGSARQAIAANAFIS